MSGRGRGYGLAVGGRGRGRGSVETGAIGAFGNPAHISLDAPTLLGGYYAPVPNVATAFPPDHPLWQDVSFITARPVQTAARVVSSAAAPVLPAAPSRPAVPARDAEPWSAEEDALLVQLHSGRKAPTDASAYAAIADKTGRSVNAVKCRWLNVLKVSR